MKNTHSFSILFVIATLFTITALKAQVSAGGSAIIIDNSIATQSLPKIKVAQNGWIFAGFITDKDYRIFRSEDNGITWAKINSNNFVLSDWDMEVTGNTDTSTQVWVASLSVADSLSVTAFNGNTGVPSYKMKYIPPFGVTCKNVAIATDYKNPGNVANPYSIAVALSVAGVSNDSLLLFISNDAGSIWQHTNVYSTVNYLHRVSLAYGYSPLKSSGTFFLAGEYNFSKTASNENQDIFYLTEREDLAGMVGPGYIDSLNRTWASNISHPDIIAENSNIENDSIDLSAIILFNTNSGLHTVGTMTALKNTTNHKSWTIKDVLSRANNETPTSGSGVFDQRTGNFVFTAGDTIGDRLNYFVINYDSINPKNDSAYVPYKIIYADNLYKLTFGDPHCDIGLNDSIPVVDWIGNDSSATFTLFNAKDTILPSGISLLSAEPMAKLFPNPSSHIININLTQPLSAEMRIDIYNLLGQKMYETTKLFSPDICIDISKWPAGSYFVSINTNTHIYRNNFIIVRE